MSELMERLARANPTETGKALTEEEQREADAVLERILADRTAVEAPRRGRLLGRVAPAGALLAVAALATVVAIDLIDSEEGEGRIIERAAAAVSQQDVIYAISVREVVTSVPVEPDADPPQREGSFGRYWIWGGGDRSRYLMYRLLPAGRHGRLESEIAVNGNRISWFHPDANVIDVMKRPSPDWPAGPTPTAIRASARSPIPARN
jgi:hypothetical protein